MLDKLTIADFAPHLNEIFQLSLGPWGQPHDPAAHGPTRMLELIEVTAIATQAPGSPTNRQAFSLIWRELSSAHLPQRIYAIKHPALGWLDLFLVPIGPDQGGMRYQAIFT